MSEPTLLYSLADIAAELGVTRAAVSNWIARDLPGVPKPQFVTSAGYGYWVSLQPWIEWRHAQKAPQREKVRQEIARLEARLSRLTEMVAE